MTVYRQNDSRRRRAEGCRLWQCAGRSGRVTRLSHGDLKKTDGLAGFEVEVTEAIERLGYTRKVYLCAQANSGDANGRRHQGPWTISSVFRHEADYFPVDGQRDARGGHDHHQGLEQGLVVQDERHRRVLRVRWCGWRGYSLVGGRQHLLHGESVGWARGSSGRTLARSYLLPHEGDSRLPRRPDAVTRRGRLRPPPLFSYPEALRTPRAALAPIRVQCPPRFPFRARPARVPANKENPR